MSNFFSKASLYGNQDKRKAAFAGTWYEADPSRLKSQLDKFLHTAEAVLKKAPADPLFGSNRELAGSVMAIVAPHAGYMFSGQTAAFAYESAAAAHKVKRVFLLGPSHYVGFRGAALPAEKSFATPLGDLQVDRQVIDDLHHTYPGFELMPEVHRREHSLEMQLPFIKESFGNVKIIPIIVGIIGDESEIQLMGQILRRYIQPDDLVVVSSDFTHYGPRYQYEPFHSNIRENVKKLDEEAFECFNQLDVHKFLAFRDRTQDTICGFYPCALLLAMLPPNTRATLLKYGTSRDTITEDDKNSVSYLAIAFSNPEHEAGWPPHREPELAISEQERKALLKIARRALEAYVQERTEIAVSTVASDVTPVMKKPMGVFVTLYKRGKNIVANMKSSDKELRGCVGYIFPIKPMVQALIDNTVGAASRDPRFKNVTADELQDLRIDINVLTPPHRVKSYKDIVIGRDGIVLYKNGHQAVFLPSVATEYGWDLEQTLSQLAIKAGCAADAWKADAQFDVFQSLSFEEP
jgi:AmmeMemoRadiSam system protein B/AmmeMemoRadiSam system protein A